MKSNRIQWALAACGLALWAALAVVFTFFDLQISQAVYAPDTAWARGLEYAGWLVTPVFLAWGAHFLLYKRGRERPSRWLTVLHLAVAAILSGFAVLLAGGVRRFAWYLPLVGVYLAGLLVILLRGWRLDERALRRIGRIVWVTVAGCAAVFILVTLLKNCAGRVRFREMETLSQFTRWYDWRPLSGNYSFPSGHTANASGVYSLVLLAPLVKARWKRAALYTLPFAFVAVMGVSRVIVGAHYSSDVLFGMGISVLFFFAVAAFAGHRRRKSAWG